MSYYWICCRSQYGQEFKKNDRLQGIGYETYLPIRKTETRTRRKVRTETSPFYPPYLFIRVIEGLTDIHPIKKEVKIVTLAGVPAKASDELINYIRSKEREGLHVVKFEYEQGDNIRLESGYFKDYEGKIIRISRGDKAIIKELTTGKEFEINLKDAKPIDA